MLEELLHVQVTRHVKRTLIHAFGSPPSQPLTCAVSFAAASPRALTV
jgi:hypothetical protein